jgi:hypothetical protein
MADNQLAGPVGWVDERLGIAKLGREEPARSW